MEAMAKSFIRKIFQAFFIIPVFAALALWTAGCAIAVPTHQVNSPQTLGKSALELGFVGASAATIGPEGEDASAITDIQDQALQELNLFFGYRLAFGVLENLDVELDFGLSMFAGALTLAGVKYQWLGDSLYAGKSENWNSSLRLRGIFASGFKDDESEEDDGIFDDIFVEKMEGSGFSVANSFGYAATTWFTPYLGAQYISMGLDYEFREDDSSGTLYKGRREFYGYGPFLGLQFHTTSPKFRLMYVLEASWTNLPGTYGDDRDWVSGFANSVSLLYSFK